MYTSLVIIDTLQMIRNAGCDNTYANDYRDLSALKKLADAHGIAILLIHHLRKEKADDVFNRISGTTAISGAVDASFTLVEEQRGSGRVRLSCIGRDIEYRELELRRNTDNVWEVTADSYQRPELLGDRIITLVSELLCGRRHRASGCAGVRRAGMAGQRGADCHPHRPGPYPLPLHCQRGVS